MAKLGTIGELERAVLEHLWRVGESDVASIHKALGRRRGIAANTVGSALERLHRKRIVARWKVSHAYRYAPLFDRDGFRALRAAEAAGGVRELASEGLLAAFVDLVAQTDDDALDRLEALVARKRAGEET